MDARADAANRGCDGSIIGVVITGDVDDPDGALCLVTVSGSDAGFAKSAVASAAIDVKTYFCGADTVKVGDVAVVCLLSPAFNVSLHSNLLVASMLAVEFHLLVRTESWFSRTIT